MDAQREYEITLLITGSHEQACIARSKARRPICPGCGDPIEWYDETIDGMHSQCAEAGATIGYADCGLW
jgi:hypothetical protein